MEEKSLERDIIDVSKSYMKKNLKAIRIGDLLDSLLKKHGIKRFEDDGSDFKDMFNKIIDDMIKNKLLKKFQKDIYQLFLEI